MLYMTVCCYQVTYTFLSECTLYSCHNVKKLLARKRREIRSLIDYNRTRTNNYLVRKITLNHLTKLASLAKLLSVCLQTKRLRVRVPLKIYDIKKLWRHFKLHL